MLIEEALFAHLKAHAGLSALIGTRIYPLVLPQNPTLPAITYQKISRVGERAMSSPTPRVARARFQISCWGTSYASVKDVAEQVKAALQDYSGLMGGSGGVQVLDVNVANEQDIYEPDTGIYHLSVDVMIYHY